MVALLSENIAKQFSMYPQKGVVQEGSDADLVVWDPRTTGVIAARTQLQNVDYTPYEGFETQGQARMVYLRGQKVAEAGQVILANQGKFVFVKQLKNRRRRSILEKIKWTANEMPKTEDKYLPLMSKEKLRKLWLFTKVFHSIQKHH